MKALLIFLLCIFSQFGMTDLLEVEHKHEHGRGFNSIEGADHFLTHYNDILKLENSSNTIYITEYMYQAGLYYTHFTDDQIIEIIDNLSMVLSKYVLDIEVFKQTDLYQKDKKFSNFNSLMLRTKNDELKFDVQMMKIAALNHKSFSKDFERILISIRSYEDYSDNKLTPIKTNEFGKTCEQCKEILSL
ncbi:hypothetical protein [Marinicellulosiphila megalodicopiae]|uniref:hypothetical protein n=1 Tax=Marinicellulosiphila megalodicopiae TaxID=2724896 RepID=UPI003BAEC2AE